jgi:PAS domain-containing protein
MRGRLVAGRDGRYLDADDSALELLGVSLEALRSMRVGDFSGPHRDLAATVWRRLAATGENMSSGEGDMYLPDGTQIRVRYTRIAALPSGAYELELELLQTAGGVGDDGPARPPISDKPSTILREWRAAEREAAAAASDGPGAMAAPDEAVDAADKLRRLYQDSVVGRSKASPET